MSSDPSKAYYDQQLAAHQWSQLNAAAAYQNPAAAHHYIQRFHTFFPPVPSGLPQSLPKEPPASTGPYHPGHYFPSTVAHQQRSAPVAHMAPKSGLKEFAGTPMPAHVTAHSHHHNLFHQGSTSLGFSSTSTSFPLSNGSQISCSRNAMRPEDFSRSKHQFSSIMDYSMQQKHHRSNGMNKSLGNYNQPYVSTHPNFSVQHCNQPVVQLLPDGSNPPPVANNNPTNYYSPTSSTKILEQTPEDGCLMPSVNNYLSHTFPAPQKTDLEPKTNSPEAQFSSLTKVSPKSLEPTCKRLKVTTETSLGGKQQQQSVAVPVYKFKNALLSRETTQDNISRPLDVQSVPLQFDVGNFTNFCQSFVDDLKSKPISVSRTPSLEAWKSAMLARADKKAEKRKAKELRKELAAEKAAALAAAAAAFNLNNQSTQVTSGSSPALGSVTVSPAVSSRLFDGTPDSSVHTTQPLPLLPQTPNYAVHKMSVEEGQSPQTESLKMIEGSTGNDSEWRQPEPTIRCRPTAQEQRKPQGPATGGEKGLKEELKPVKKGGGTLWAMPIVPKMPQKVSDKRKSGGKLESSEIKVCPVSKTTTTTTAAAAASNADIWRQAFGAVKSKKQVEVFPSVKQEIASCGGGGGGGKSLCQKNTYINVPPEVRRKSRPLFGGLIHFSPDWEKAVKEHHEKCRMPASLVKAINAKPKILATASLSVASDKGFSAKKEPLIITDDNSKYNSLSSYLGNPDNYSPPKVSGGIGSTTIYAGSSVGKKKEVFEVENDYPYLTFRHRNKASSPGNEEGGGGAHLVDSILSNRKKLRLSRMGRMFMVPFKKSKKKPVNKSTKSSYAAEECMGLLATPGLPLLTAETTEVLMTTQNFGNFRRQTLLRYLDSLNNSPELKAKILDWKPEVFETKTRGQLHQVKAITSYREIFGINLPESGAGKRLKEETVDGCADIVSSDHSLVKSKRKPFIKGQQPPETAATHLVKGDLSAPPPPPPAKRGRKRKHLVLENVARSAASNEHPITSVEIPKVKKAIIATTNIDNDDDDDNDIPTETDQQLQDELQRYALQLIQENQSWEKRKVIQKLVIWEPVDPIPLAVDAVQPGVLVGPTDPLLSKRDTHWSPLVCLPSTSNGRRRKSKKKKAWGMDFAKRKSVGKFCSNRDVCRGGSPLVTPEDLAGGDCVRSVLHSLDHVINESRHWVLNKSAGETILHRAAKTGLTDIAAYALSVNKMSPMVKDNAGILPIHVAAYHGNADVVEILLKFNADPNTSVKGTRPLHEALDGGFSLDCVHKIMCFGADPLLYDYSGNMPIDIAEAANEEMFDYFAALCNDLHGLKLGSNSLRWNVSHCEAFSNPHPSLLQSEEETPDLEESFVSSFQPLPPFYRIGDKDGHYVVRSDLDAFTSIDFDVVASAKYESFTLSRDEFVKTARCCLLGHRVDLAFTGDRIRVVKVNDWLQQLMRGDDELTLETTAKQNYPTS